MFQIGSSETVKRLQDPRNLYHTLVNREQLSNPPSLDIYKKKNVICPFDLLSLKPKEYQDFHSFLLGLKNFILLLQARPGIPSTKQQHRDALIAGYCCCCSCSEELHLRYLALCLKAFIGDHYPQQLEDPCLHILQDPPVDTSLYDHWCEPPTHDEGSIHCVVGGALPVSTVQTMSCSQYHTQSGFLFSYLLVIFICFAQYP